MLRAAFVLCVLASLGLGTPGHAQTGAPAATTPTTTVAPTPPTSQAPRDLREPRAIITLQIENDVFTRWARSDKDYTNGVRLGWLSAPIVMPSWLTTFTTLPTFFGEPPATGAVRRWGFSIGQNIYTPENTSTREPIFDDRPYAGWAYIGFALQYTYTRDNEPVRLDTLQLDFGVVGPAAQGRFVQNKFHSLIGVDKAHGWSNQLDNQVTVNLTFERRWRTGRFKLIEDPDLEVDFIPSLGVGIGNAQTYAGVGGIMRIGNDLRDDFGPPRARPSLPGSETFTTRDDFGWYLFVGAGGQAFAYNNFLDRKAFAGGPDINSRIFVGELSAGLALLFRGVRFSYTHVVRSPEFSERKRLHQYGSLSLAIRY
jgi:lipid A 3-O-deacylase